MRPQESELTTDEKPTPEPQGASIEERLERWLTAEPATEQQPKEPVKAEQPTNAATETAETEPKPTDDGATEQEQQPQLSTSDLAKVFGVDESMFDVDGDGNVVVKTKVDGKEVAPKFAELLQSYQVKGHADNRAREAAEAIKAAEARKQEVEQVVQQRLAHVEQLANVAGAELMREYQSIDWNTLRQTDPGQWAALRQDFNARKAQIASVFQNVAQGNAQQKQQLEAQKAQYLAQEAEKLPTVIPEWKDQAVADKESKDILEWGLKAGYSRDQLNALNESSALHIATVRKAMLFDKLQQSRPEIENKVRLAPKIVKPGQTQAEDQKTVNLRNLKAQVTKTGGKNGTLEAYLLATGKV